MSAGVAFAAKDQLTVDLSQEPLYLDPHMTGITDTVYVHQNMFDSLLIRDKDMKIAPHIATSWKYLSDTELEMQIRTGVKFHDGTDLTTEDVAYSINRIIQPSLGSTYITFFNWMEKAEVLPDNKIRITLKRPFPAGLTQLVKLAIIPKAYIEKVGAKAFNEKPIGSGPYRFASRQQGLQVTLERNENYWGTPGPFKTVVFRTVVEPSTRVADLLAGTADIAVTLNTDQAKQLEGNSKVEVRSVLTERVSWLQLNLKKPKMQDLRLRQAIAYAIDRDTISSVLLGNIDKPSYQLIAPITFGFRSGEVGMPKYDLEKAKKIVAELPAEIRSAELELLTASHYDLRVVEAIQAMLAAVGLNVKPVSINSAAYQQKYLGDVANRPEITFNRWSCLCQDADATLFPLLHSSSSVSFGVATSKEIDAILEEARGSLNEATRRANYAKVGEWVDQTLSYVPLYQMSFIYGVDKRLRWQPAMNESMYINRMEWAE